MSASPAPALAQALENYADIQDSKQELSLTDRVRFLHDSAEAMRAAADALRAAVRGAETPTCATHGDPLVCLACEADEDKHPAWRQACPKCGGLPPGEASGAGDLCYCTPAAVPPAPAPLEKKRTSLELEEALYLGAAEAAPLPPQGEPDWRKKFERSQMRWGNLKQKIKDEIVSFTNPCLSTQQRHQYANGVARLNWVLDEMRKSPDVLAEALAPPPPVPRGEEPT